MKKVLTVFAVAGMLAFYACGPSAEEKAAMDKAREDSIQKVKEAEEAMEKARQDSIAAVEKAKQDSIEAAEKAKQDSIAAAEDAKKNKPKTGSNKPKDNVPKTVTTPGGRPGATKQ
jgi:uncharacterized membrane protein